MKKYQAGWVVDRSFFVKQSNKELILLLARCGVIFHQRWRFYFYAPPPSVGPDDPSPHSAFAKHSADVARAEPARARLIGSFLWVLSLNMFHALWAPTAAKIAPLTRNAPFCSSPPSCILEAAT